MSNEAVRQRQTVHVRQAHRAMGKPRMGKTGAGEGEHGLGGVHTQPLAHARGEQLQHATGAGADIQEPARRVVRDQRQQRVFHRLRGQVEGAHFVPVGAFAAEAFGGDPGPLGQHAGGLTAIGFQDRVIGGKTGDQVPSQCAVLALRQGEPDIRALPHPVQQAAIAQQLQVAGQPGLRLAEDFGELHHAETAAGGEREQPQPGRLSDGAQAGEEAFHAVCVT